MSGKPAQSATRLFAICCSLYCLCQMAQAQATPILSSNVESTSGTTSTGRKTTASGGPTALPDDFSKLRLEHADAISFDVYGVPEMSQLLSIDDDGDVIVPLVGRVHVAGETIREAEGQIQQALIERKMLNSPLVTLKILEYAKQAVMVSGEVQAPGKVQLLAPRSLLDVLAQVGGETTAAGGEVEIRHVGPDGMEHLTRVMYIAGKDPVEAKAAIVSPGDSVYVQRAGVVYVLGAVGRPGGYLMVNGGKLTVPQAIALAQGTTIVASNKEVLIVRKRDGQITRLVTSLKEQETGRLAVVALTDGDMLYVPTSKIKAALVNSSAVISSAASAGIVVGLQKF